MRLHFLFLLMVMVGIARSGFADGFVSPLINLVIVPAFSPGTPSDEQPYTKVFSKGAYFVFPNADSADGARLLWAEPEDPDLRSVFGHGDVIALTAKQRARAYELCKLLSKEGVTEPETFPLVLPYPRKKLGILAPSFQKAADFSDPSSGETLGPWVGLKVDLNKNRKPERVSLLFQYVDSRSDNGEAYLSLDLNSSNLPLRTFPEIDLTREETCLFGLDLGEGPKAVRVLGFAAEGQYLYVAYEQQLLEARAKPAYVRLFKIPAGNLRLLPRSGIDKKLERFAKWTRATITMNEMNILHESQDPFVMAVNVPSDLSSHGFHLYLAQQSQTVVRSLASRYSLFVALENGGARWRQCKRNIVDAGRFFASGILDVLGFGGRR